MNELLQKVEQTLLNGAEFGRLRRAKGLTLKQVAERVGLSESFVCDVERGRRIAKQETAMKLAAVVRR